MTIEQATCSHCGKKRGRGGLKAAPGGGAICKNWFQCQQHRDERIAAIAPNRKQGRNDRT